MYRQGPRRPLLVIIKDSNNEYKNGCKSISNGPKR